MSLLYPVNAKTLLSYSGEELRKFSLVAKVSETEGQILVSVEAESIIVVANEDLSSRIFKNTGVKLPTRREIANKKYFLESNEFVLGVSAFLELDLDQLRVMPLLQRDLNAPSNPGKWTSPGGLCNKVPLYCMQEEMAEEIGLIEYSDESDTQKILVPILDEFIQNKDKTNEIIALKNWQESFIKNQISKKFGKMPFEYRVLKVEQRSMPESVKTIFLKMPGDEKFERTNFIGCIDDSVKGFTLGGSFRANLDSKMKYHLVDPEPFQRKTNLVTRDLFLNLDCTKALNFARQQKVCFSN